MSRLNFLVHMETLWNHSANASVESMRRDPNIRKEGELVHILAVMSKEELEATEKPHQFRHEGAPGVRRLVVKQDHKARQNTPHVLAIEALHRLGKTAGEILR